MALEAIMERFKKSSPLTVMVRLVMQQALSREWMEEVFERNRDKQLRAPDHVEHRFRGKWNTDSGACGTPIPAMWNTDSGQVERTR
jgi:hypothetical protein